MEANSRWVCSAVILAMGGLMGCGGDSPVAPTDPGLPVLSVKVRSEGLLQDPVDGEYRLPAAKTGSVHLLVTLPNVDRRLIRLRVGFEDCRTPDWSVVYDGIGFHDNMYYPALLQNDAQEYARRTWASWDIADPSWEATRLWPRPGVCVFVGKVTVEAPEYSAPVEVTATAVLHFY